MLSVASGISERFTDTSTTLMNRRSSRSPSPPRPLSISNSRSHSPTRSSFAGEFRQRTVSRNNGPEEEGTASHNSPPTESMRLDTSPFNTTHPHLPIPSDPAPGRHSTSHSPTENYQYTPSYHPPRRVCRTCNDDAPSGWRRSIDHIGQTVCNKCGLAERARAKRHRESQQNLSKPPPSSPFNPHDGSHPASDRLTMTSNGKSHESMDAPWTARKTTSKDGNRECYSCHVSSSAAWRTSLQHPGQTVCNRCGLRERKGRERRVQSAPNLAATHQLAPYYSRPSQPDRNSTSGSQGPPSHDAMDVDAKDQPIPTHAAFGQRTCTACGVTSSASWRRSLKDPSQMLCNKCGLRERKHAKSAHVSMIKDSKTRIDGLPHPISVSSSTRDLELPPIRNPDSPSGIIPSLTPNDSQQHTENPEQLGVPTRIPGSVRAEYSQTNNLTLPRFNSPRSHLQQVNSEAPHLHVQTQLPAQSQHYPTHAQTDQHSPLHSHYPHSVSISPVGHFNNNIESSHANAHGHGITLTLPRIQTPSTLHQSATTHHQQGVSPDPYPVSHHHASRSPRISSQVHSPVYASTQSVHHQQYHFNSPYSPVAPIVPTIQTLPPIQVPPHNQNSMHSAHHGHSFCHSQVSPVENQEVDGSARPSYIRGLNARENIEGVYPHHHHHAPGPYPHHPSEPAAQHQSTPHFVERRPHVRNSGSAPSGDENYNSKVYEWIEKNQRSQAQEIREASSRSQGGRKCFSCSSTSSNWRNSVVYPGQSVCQRCGTEERRVTESRSSNMRKSSIYAQLDMNSTSSHPSGDVNQNDDRHAVPSSHFGSEHEPPVQIGASSRTRAPPPPAVPEGQPQQASAAFPPPPVMIQSNDVPLHAHQHRPKRPPKSFR